MGEVQPPLLVETTCGYCGGLLAPVNDSRRLHYQCPRCAPLLAEVKDEAEWVAFHRRAARAPETEAQ